MNPRSAAWQKPARSIRKHVSKRRDIELGSSDALKSLADIASASDAMTTSIVPQAKQFVHCAFGSEDQSSPVPSDNTMKPSDGSHTDTSTEIATPIPTAPSLRRVPSFILSLLPSIPETSSLSGESERSPRSAFVPVSPPQVAESTRRGPSTAKQLKIVERQLATVFESIGPSLVTAGRRIETDAAANNLGKLRWLAVPTTLRAIYQFLARILGFQTARDMLSSTAHKDSIDSNGRPLLPTTASKDVFIRLGAAITQAGAIIAAHNDKVGQLGWILEPKALSLYYALKSNGPDVSTYLPFCIKFQPCVEKAKVYGLL